MTPTLLSILLLAAPATDPCEGLVVADGAVKTARRLASQAPVPAPDIDCARAVGRALKERKVRSVTVAVRLPDALRAGGAGQKVADAYATALAAGGVPQPRISTVLPAADAGEVIITFTERRGKRPVARLTGAQGEVSAGRNRTLLEKVSEGEGFRPKTWVQTGAKAVARLDLADGSKVKLLASTLLKLGKLQLNDQLKREVELELAEGKLETDVSPGGEGSSFQIRTASGVAGVRGTAFRLRGDAEGTEIETLEGAVEMSNAGQSVVVNAGQATRVKPGLPPEPPRNLLPAPEAVSPLQGGLSRGGELRWKSVSGAVKYRVDLARDAEFIYEGVALETEANALGTEKLELPAGKWFWRVRALDGEGFGGQTSKVYAFEWSP